MKPFLLDILVCPGTKRRLRLEEPLSKNGEIVGGFLCDDVSGQRYPILDGVPVFVGDGRLVTGRGAERSYKSSSDLRAKWKSLVRRYPALTRVLQFVFDPAHVSHAARNRLLASLGPDGLVLNVGAGVKRLPMVCSVNLDIELFGNVDVVADGQEAPFADGSFDAVILEYVIEHVLDSSRITSEIHRILKPGGHVYATVPFMQAYHGNPDDYHRFTETGLRELWRDFECIECGPFGGPSSALVCVMKEYLAVLLSLNSKTVYSVLSQVLIIPFFPLKYLDVVLARTRNAHNVAFSLVYVGKKRSD